MEWLRIEEASFYALVWAFAFLVSLFRTLGSDDSQSLRMCFFSSGVVGFFAFAVVSFWIGRDDPDQLRGHWYYLGVATLIGLAGPLNQTMLATMLKNLGLLGVTDAKTET